MKRREASALSVTNQRLVLTESALPHDMALLR